MVRTLSAAAELARLRSHAELIPLLEITLWRDKFTPSAGSITLRFSDQDRVELGEEWLGFLVQWGDLEQFIDLSSKLDVVIANSEPIAGAARFSDLLRHAINTGTGTYDFHFADATLKLIFAGAVAGDEINLRLLGEEIIELGPTQLTARFSGVELMLDLQDGAASFSNVQPDRLLTCGFEENNRAETVWDLAATPANLAFIGSPVHSGALALRSSPTASIGALGRDMFSVAQFTGHVYGRFYVYVEAAPTGAKCVLAATRSSGDAEELRVELGTDMLVSLVNGITTSFVTSSIALSTGKWYRIEYHQELDASTTNARGEMECRIYNGDDITPLDTLLITQEQTVTGGGVQKFWFGPITTTTVSVVFDDIAIEFFTALQTHDFIGPGKIVLVVPDSDVAVTWTRVGGGSNNFEAVDDLPGLPDDATTHVFSTVEDDADKYGITLPGSVPADAVFKAMHLMARYASSQAVGDGPGALLRVWDDEDREVDGPGFSVVGTAYRFTISIADSVVNIAGKQHGQVNAYSIGVVATEGSTEERRITALWGNVEYRDPF
jgi:hypothetical protein